MTEQNQSTAEFDEFIASGEVEVGDSNLASDKPDEKKPAAKQPDPAPEEADEGNEREEADQDDGDPAPEEGDDQDAGDEEGDKPKKSAREHQIERLKREKAEMARQLKEAEKRGINELLQKIENLENRLAKPNSNDNSANEIPAPDPTDFEKYPLGHLDDRYIEDKLEWVAEKKAAERAEAVLQRQQETEQRQAAERQQQELLGKVDDLATRGSDISDDFQELVVEAGMRGDWDLSQPTFEAAHEAENGAQILYELAQDKQEAARVAKLSPYQQLKFVQERDAEIGKSKTGRRIPKAGEPPKNVARGANSRTQINPATDNLDDFEKAWELDAKRGMR